MQTSTRPPLFSTDDLEAVSAAFLDEAHLEQTARSILRMIGRRLRADAAVLLVADAAGRLHLTGVYNPGELVPPEILEAGPDSLAMRASLTRHPAAIMIGPDDRPAQSLDGDSSRSALALPLLAGSELQGVLVLSRRRRFERRDLVALRHVAHHVALGMRYARLAMRLPERPIGDSDREPELVSSDPPVKGRELLDSVLQPLPGDEPSNVALARKQVQELAALADGERRRLYAVLENLPVGVVIVEANGSVSLMNREAEHLMGRRFILGKNVLESTPGYPVYTPHGEPLSPDEWPLVRSLRNGEVL